MSIDVASLVFEIDSTQADPAEARLNRLAAAGDRVDASARRVKSATELAGVGMASSANGSAAAAKSATELATAQGAVEKATRAATVASAQTRATRALEAAAMRELSAATKAFERDQARTAASVAGLRASIDPLRASVDRVNAELAEASSLFKRGAIDAEEYGRATTVLNARIVGLSGAQAKGVGSTKALTQAGLNLSRQFADVAVTAAMGMNPIMILIQQGPQIADAFAMAKTQGLGFSAVVKGLAIQLGLLKVVQVEAATATVAQTAANNAVAASATEAAAAEAALAAATTATATTETAATATAAGLATANEAVTATATTAAAAEAVVLAPLALVLGGLLAIGAVLGGGLLLATRNVNKEHKDFAKTLGLTADQLERVKNKGITMGDVLKGTFNWLASGAGKAFKPMLDWFSNLFDAITRGTVGAIKGLVGGFVGAYDAIKATWGLLPSALGDAAISTANGVLSAIEKMINGTSSLLNKLIDKANQAAKAVGLTVTIPTLGQVSVPRLANPNAGAANNAAATAGAAFSKGNAEGGAMVDRALDGLTSAILDAAKKRILKKAGHAPKGPAEPRDQTDERNAALDAAEAQAQANRLQAQLGLTHEVEARASLQKKVLDQELVEKQAKIDQTIAAIKDDKGLSDVAQAELVKRYEALKSVEAHTAALKKQAIDDAAVEELSQQQLAVAVAGRESSIDVLRSQQDLTKSSFARSAIDTKILNEQYAIEKAKLLEQALSLETNETDTKIAAAKLATLELVHKNQLALAEEQTRLVNAIQETIDATQGFKDALSRHDWGAVFDELQRTLSTIKTSFDLHGLTGGLATAGGALGSLLGGKVGGALSLGAGVTGLVSGLPGLAASLLPGLADSGALMTGIGQLAGLAGPIGIGVALIASLAPLLLSSKPSNHAGIAKLTPDSFSLVSSGKETDETTKAVTGAAQAALQGEALIKSFGITLKTLITGFDLGTRDETHIFLSTGEELRSAVGDAGAAAEAGLKAVLQGATFASDAQKSLVESMLAAGKGFDDISTALQGYAAAQAISGALADQILQLSDPKAFDLQQVQREIDAQSAAAKAAADAGYLTAEQLAGINAQIVVIRGLQLDAVLKKYGDAVQAATDATSKAASDAAIQRVADAQAAVSTATANLLTAYNAQASAIQSSIASFQGLAANLRAFDISVGASNVSSPDAQVQKSAAKSAFDKVASRNDPGAVGEFQASAQAFLTAAKAAAPDAETFAHDVTYVRRATEKAAKAADNSAAFAAAQLYELTNTVSKLTDINANVITVASAIRELNGALAAQTAAIFANSSLAGMQGGGATAAAIAASVANDNARDRVAATYQGYLDAQAAANPMHFATGGSFTVGGSGGPDSKAFNMALSPGEAVNVAKPGEAVRGAGGTDTARLETLVESLTEKVAQLQQGIADTAKSTDRLAAKADRWDRGGLFVRGQAPDQPVQTAA